MCRSCVTIIDGVWNSLAKNQMFKTPDEIQGVMFTISEVRAEDIRITPQNIIIKRQAFLEAIHYLKTNHHDKDHSINIQSSNNPNMSGHLCTVTREKNEGARCINYILPILSKHNLVGIKSTRPNKTWII